MEEPRGVELIDYLRVFWKWKWFIILFTLCSGIIAGLISFSMPNIYETFMMIEPGVIGLDRDLKIVEIESAINIKFKINSQAYNSRVLKHLNNDTQKVSLNFKAVQPTASNAIKIILETTDANKGMQALTSLFQAFSDEYKIYVDSRRSEFDEKIKMNERILENYRTDKKKLEKEMTLTNAKANSISGEINNLIVKEGGGGDKLYPLIYASIIQQNKSHYNNLSKRLGNIMTGIETAKSEIEILEIKKKYIQNIKLIQAPQSSRYPIKPKRKTNVVMGLIVGFIVSILISFFIEYIQKMKSHPDSSIASE